MSNTTVTHTLKLNWCSHEAAKYAVEHWHYSQCMPAGKLVKIGVWENGRFTGTIMFGRGANRHIGSSYGLKQNDVCELVRVALDKHKTPVTRLNKIAIKMLKKNNPGLKLIVSYADGNQNHLGKIYQAGNWIYEGEFAKERGIILNGKMIHRRTVNAKYGTSSIKWLKKHIDSNSKKIIGKPKYKYLYPLNKQTRKQIQNLSKPYPKDINAVAN